MLHRALLGVIVSGMLLLGIGIACGDGDNGGDELSDGAVATEAPDSIADPQPSTVQVALFEWSVKPSTASVSAGDVTFQIENTGMIPHNLEIIRTDLEPDSLPVDEVSFVVDAARVDVVASSDVLNDGQSEELTTALEPGSYVLICNVPTHYETGMSIGFTVE